MWGRRFAFFALSTTSAYFAPQLFFTDVPLRHGVSFNDHSNDEMTSMTQITSLTNSTK